MTVRRIPNSPFWYYDFWHRKRRYKGTTKKTSKARAQDYERRLIYQLEQGRDPFFRSPLMKDLVSQYLGWVEVNRSADHVDRSRRAIKNVLDRMPRVKTAEEITPSRIEDFKRRRLREVSPNTVNLELRHFKAFLRRCVKQGWLQEMPVEIEQVKAPERHRVVFLTDAEINPFLDSLRPWARETARFFILTGLRLDEGRFLEWQDVDLDVGQVWVKNKPELGFSPKNGKERVVHLPPELIEDLRALKRPSGWVLRGDRGGQVDRRGFQTAVAKAGESAGYATATAPSRITPSPGTRLTGAADWLIVTRPSRTT